LNNLKGKDLSFKNCGLRDSGIKELGNLGIKNSSVPKFQDSEIH
jgi:hypothetical protein